MQENIKRLLEDCFKHLGVEAIYCNRNKEGIRRIKVLIKRPETTYSLGADGALTQQIASVEIRDQDVTSFSIG
ncbi:head-tail joining protein, partial [Wolbachia endosymbiont of Cylisticus convexus]|uniref:head-tail joining protein n=2 Tax=unclassified Wolbachia TaxID=2640676 RepID=UPI000DF6C84F